LGHRHSVTRVEDLLMPDRQVVTRAEQETRRSRDQSCFGLTKHSPDSPDPLMSW
jgi:hypothetical protein